MSNLSKKPSSSLESQKTSFSSQLSSGYQSFEEEQQAQQQTFSYENNLPNNPHSQQLYQYEVYEEQQPANFFAAGNDVVYQMGNYPTQIYQTDYPSQHSYIHTAAPDHQLLFVDPHSQPQTLYPLATAHQVYQPSPLSRQITNPAKTPNSGSGSRERLRKKESGTRLAIEDLGPKRRFCCGLFSTTRQFMICLLPSLLLAALGIGLFLFFCWPRAPLLYLNPLQDYTGLQTSGSPQTGNFQASFTMVSNFTTTSSNYIDWTIKTFDVSGSIQHPDGSGFQGTQGGIKANRQGLVMKSQGSSSFGLIVSVGYAMEAALTKKSEVSSKAPILFAWAMSCNATGFGYQEYPNHNPGNIGLQLSVSMSYDPISFIPLSSSMSSAFKCTPNMLKMLSAVADTLT